MYGCYLVLKYVMKTCDKKIRRILTCFIIINIVFVRLIVFIFCRAYVIYNACIEGVQMVNQ